MGLIDPSRQTAKTVAARPSLTGQVEETARLYPGLHARPLRQRRADTSRPRPREEARRPCNRR